jgi:hypothetical protein
VDYQLNNAEKAIVDYQLYNIVKAVVNYQLNIMQQEL